MTKPVPKLVMEISHAEDYVNFVGYLVTASDQKFLIEKGEDEVVTELMIPVRNVGAHCSGDPRGLRDDSLHDWSSYR